MKYIINLLKYCFYIVRYKRKVYIKKLPKNHRLPKIEAYGGKVSIGNNFMTNKGCYLKTVDKGRIIIGNNVFMNHNCIITAMGNISIGDDAKIGPNVMIFDHDHEYRNHNDDCESYIINDITIGKNCWIGAGTIILRGCNIGDNCVIAAGTVIKESVDDNTLVYRQVKMVKKEIW